MRNIFLIILLIFFSLKIFSQNKSEIDTYNSLSSVEEKLDFLFFKIFNKQINDFNELENKNLSLEKKLKSESLTKLRNEIKNLNDSIYYLNNFIDVQKQSIKDKNREYSQLNNKLNLSLEKNEKTKESIRTLRSKIEAELKLVENYSGSLDHSLLGLLEVRAKNNNLPTYKLSEIKELNKLIFRAELILSKPINTANIDDIYNSLDKISSFHSDWHKNKISSLKLLLDNYCPVNSELIKVFSHIDEENLEEHNGYTLDYLNSQRIKLVNYPFLGEELEKKIANITNSDRLKKCN